MLPKLTMVGRLTADPNLRFLESGIAVCSFTVVANDRKKDDSGEWQDSGDPLFVRVTAWRQLGENAAESLSKGDLAVVIGKLSQRKYTDNDGNERTSLELTADTVAPSLQFRQVKHSTERRSQRQQSSDDPWAAPPRMTVNLRSRKEAMAKGKTAEVDPKELTSLQNAAYNAAWSRLREKYREEYDSFIDEEFAARNLERHKRSTAEERKEREERERKEKAERAFDKLLADHPSLFEYAKTALDGH